MTAFFFWKLQQNNKLRSLFRLVRGLPHPLHQFIGEACDWGSGPDVAGNAGAVLPLRVPTPADAAEHAQELSAKALLAVKLNELIDKRGLSQTEVARITGMTQPKVSQVRRYKLQDLSYPHALPARKRLLVWRLPTGFE